MTAVGRHFRRLAGLGRLGLVLMALLVVVAWLIGPYGQLILVWVWVGVLQAVTIHRYRVRACRACRHFRDGRCLLFDRDAKGSGLCSKFERRPGFSAKLRDRS